MDHALDKIRGRMDQWHGAGWTRNRGPDGPIWGRMDRGRMDLGPDGPEFPETGRNIYLNLHYQVNKYE